MRKLKRVAVTGGAGFIGANFVFHLLGKYQNIELANIDGLTRPSMNSDQFQYVPTKEDGCEFLNIQIQNRERMKEVLKEKDIIINLAAETHVDRSIRDVAPFLQSNILGVHSILEAIKDTNKVLVHISTDEVYGARGSEDADERARLLPNNPYSASKASADLLIRSYVRTHGVKAIIMRLSNNYGAYQWIEKAIPLFTTNIIKGKKIPIYGKGNQSRTWLHVLDTCEAIELVASEGKIGEIYNVQGQTEITNVELARDILGTFGLEYTGWVEFVEDRKGHDKRYGMNCDKIKELGWKPKIEWEQGLLNTVLWYKQNPEWWGGKNV